MLAIPFITIAGVFQLFDSLQAVGAGLARGLKDSMVPMVLAIVSYWLVGFTGAYVLAFPLKYGGIGIWVGFVAGLAVAAVSLNTGFVVLVRRPTLVAAT
ncbi:MATE family efflux transporter, partial [Mesorhizobium sp.]|uniref:MATE family efflux transporter n=2 Tax=unclassified Mesorhizobium TaxID=325217 RepID=UPI0025C53780